MFSFIKLSLAMVSLYSNKTLAEKGDRCFAMLIKVPYRFCSFLPDVLDSHEFDAYTTKIIPPSRSLSKFCNAPYLVYVENKGGD